jgi:hypothetical protein
MTPKTLHDGLMDPSCGLQEAQCLPFTVGQENKLTGLFGWAEDSFPLLGQFNENHLESESKVSNKESLSHFHLKIMAMGQI